MNREDIIRMAREAHKELVTKDYPGHFGQLDPWTIRLMERFAYLVAAAERQRIIESNKPEIESINAHIKALEDVVVEREAMVAKLIEIDALKDDTFIEALRARGETTLRRKA